MAKNTELIKPIKPTIPDEVNKKINASTPNIINKIMTAKSGL